MIEFLVGTWVGGWFAWSIGRTLLRVRARELAAENRALREGLRYLRDVTPRSPVTRAYIDRLLDDEAGS